MAQKIIVKIDHVGMRTNTRRSYADITASHVTRNAPKQIKYLQNRNHTKSMHCKQMMKLNGRWRE